MDTYFDIIPDGNRFQMKYTDNTDNNYNNLIDFSDENNLFARTHGDWGGDRLLIGFYGEEQKINFFTLREGSGHFYFVKITDHIEFMLDEADYAADSSSLRYTREEVFTRLKEG